MDGLTLELGDCELLGDSELDGLGVCDCDDDGERLEDGDALDDGEGERLPLALGEVEVEMDADGEGLTEGEPSTMSIGASTTANATLTVSSVCHAISTSSLDNTTRRRNDNQRRLVKVGTVESSVRISFVPLGIADSIRLNTIVLSK